LTHAQSSPLQSQGGTGHFTAQSQMLAQLAEASDASRSLGVRLSSATVLRAEQAQRVDKSKASRLRFMAILFRGGLF